MILFNDFHRPILFKSIWKLQPPSCKTAKTTEESAPTPQKDVEQVLNHDQLEELFNEEVGK